MPDHIAAGATTMDDGRPMSIHVEMIGETLMVQHYVGEFISKKFCRMVSQSDAISPSGRTKVKVVWELCGDCSLGPDRTPVDSGARLGK